jgi:hypothetical protein
LRQAQSRKPKVRCLPQLGPNNPLELTAHSAGFVGYSWRFFPVGRSSVGAFGFHGKRKVSIRLT